MKSDSEEELKESLIISTPELEKAWHIFSLLVFIGRPARLRDLASRCILFPASPALISHICSIPNSPITLLNNNRVAISPTGLSFFATYLARIFTVDNANASSPTRFSGFPTIRLGKRKIGEDEEGKELVLASKRIRNCGTEVQYHLTNKMMRIVEFPSFLVNNFALRPYSLAETSVRLLSYRVDGMGTIESEWVVANYTGRTVRRELVGSEVVAEENRKEHKLNLESQSQGAIELLPSVNTELLAERDLEDLDDDNCSPQMRSLCEEFPTLSEGPTVVHSVNKRSVPKEQQAKTSQMLNEASVLQSPSKSLGHTTIVHTYKRKQHCQRDRPSVRPPQKSNQNPKDICVKERRGNSTTISAKDQPKPEVLPDFESYVIEEEEGSGGYGTVYRARRKNDGNLVAIKRPHANAHKHYVDNELRMLQRFGGRNFVIRYEEYVKSGNVYCFVLEYVEHDRPEVLKKEINVFQLQWYAYCLFKALAYLHKEGVVHRDVKPGNFLFSRKTNKGYLIDFNLAMNLHQKYRSLDKSKLGYDASCHRNTVPAKAIHPANSSKLYTKSLEGGATKGSKLSIQPKNMKKTAGQRNSRNDLSSWNKINSQGADGSGITSAKDVSARTPSAERLREPLPCQGRKELISLLQEAMQNPNHRLSHVPAPMRKRVAASPGRLDRQLLHPTPMPLNATSLAIAGVDLSKNKGDGKHKREGPCAGTKGFRAPEVLFRSQYQGPKLDIWSAGVTLLYLMIGKSPFVGDPEQNIKDIAKLRGSEDLWEVAKLHNRESSFPEELYGTRSLTPINLREWCQMNTKRQDFLQELPSSLYDLVDKCLTVNPRSRITAEDALKHEFFASIHENLRKHRAAKQGHGLDPGTKNRLLRERIANKSLKASLEIA